MLPTTGLKPTTPPKSYPANVADENGLWPVTPKLNPEYESPSRGVQDEIKAGVIIKKTNSDGSVSFEYQKNESARSLSEIEFTKDGTLLFPGASPARPYNDGNYVFAVDKGGSLILGTRTENALPHPTLIGGKDPRVLTAGELVIKNGEIVEINNQTGHFRSDINSLLHAKGALDTAWKSKFGGSGYPLEVPLRNWKKSP